MGSIFELPMPFEVLNQAVERCLPGYICTLVSLELRVSPAGAITYRMNERLLGDVGQVTLYRKTERISELDFADPPPPRSRKPNQNELADISAVSDVEERFQAKARLLRKIDDEAKVLYEQRKKHHDLVIEAFFNHLIDDYGHLYPFLESDDLQADIDDTVHIRNLIELHTRRLRLREEQAAIQGVLADPIIAIEIDDIRSELSRLNAQLNQM